MTAPAADMPDKPLWDALKALIRLFTDVFGQPTDLLDEGAFRRSEARLAGDWLKGLERVVRALLLVMAARLPRPAPGRAGGGRRPARPAPPPSWEDPELDGPPPETPPSETWAGVAFRALPPEERGGGRGGRSARSAGRTLVFTRSYAFRFEAIIRVAESPEPFARRLARRLWAAGALVRRLLRPPAPEPFGRERPWTELTEQALPAARAAARIFAPDTG